MVYVVISASMDDDTVWMPYQMSYMWYTLVGAVVSILVALAVSFIRPSKQTKKTPHSLLSPMIHRFLEPADEKVCKPTLQCRNIVKRLSRRGVAFCVGGMVAR